ncbi:MAG: Asp-tRNA(Asn)/Glu-tRNA(Gln) amidotransferase subunit GatC [Verrucomicrobiota bacterium]
MRRKQISASFGRNDLKACDLISIRLNRQSVSKDSIHIQEVAKLARIAIDSEEAEVLGPQLEKVVDYIKQLEKVDISAVPDTPIDPALPTNVLRDDLPKESLSHEDAIHNAPKSNQGEIVMPKIVE